MIFVCMCFLTNRVLMNNSDVFIFSMLFFFFHFTINSSSLSNMSIKINTDALLTNKTDHFIIALFENI